MPAERAPGDSPCPEFRGLCRRRTSRNQDDCKVWPPDPGQGQSLFVFPAKAGIHALSPEERWPTLKRSGFLPAQERRVFIPIHWDRKAIRISRESGNPRGFGTAMAAMGKYAVDSCLRRNDGAPAR